MTGRAGSFVLAAGLAVSGCGGGGGTVASTSTPTTTSPAYSTFAAATAAGQTIGGSGAALSRLRQDNASTPTYALPAVSSIQVTYDSATRTYLLRSAIGSATTTDTRFGPADLTSDVGSYDRTTSSGGITRYERFRTGNSLTVGTATTTYTYLGWGAWSSGSTAPALESSVATYFAYGIPTETGDMPRTGSASYALALTGEGTGAPLTGTGTVSANFAAGSVAVTLLPTFIYRSGQVIVPFATLAGNGSISGSGFTSLLAGDGLTGTINGGFYGPQAIELGAGFTLSQNGAPVAAGVALGRRN